MSKRLTKIEINYDVSEDYSEISYTREIYKPRLSVDMLEIATKVNEIIDHINLLEDCFGKLYKTIENIEYYLIRRG